ncbi:MAG: tat (twin-arginine translocation) pathway signal sequence, partial [Ignavibacteria bacterium]|nr:tat (twin-arginine translocation) pathway signal sequence [Ignavibacteria bacterium]
MRRREFISKTVKAGLVTGAALSVGGYYKIFPFPYTSDYDLAAIKGGEPDVMFDEAIKAFGGMSKFVKKGQTVVVKPNIGWDVVPERAGNTNPLLVNRIIKH